MQEKASDLISLKFKENKEFNLSQSNKKYESKLFATTKITFSSNITNHTITIQIMNYHKKEVFDKTLT